MSVQSFDSKKLEYIEDYFCDHIEDEFVYLILHSLFNCISEKELQVLYFENAKGNPFLKKTIESYIIKRTTNEPKRQFESVALTLLNRYSDQSYQTQITTRVFLSKFIRSLSTEAIQLYFDKFIHSNRKFDRHRANEVADLIWNDETEGKLTDNFHKYQDEYSLIPLIKNLDSKNLCLLIENCWSKDFPSASMKNEIVKKIAKLDVEYFSFLRETDVSFYIQALNIKRIQVSDSLIEQLLLTESEENKYYLVWTIGATGNWNETIKYIESLKLKRKMHRF